MNLREIDRLVAEKVMGWKVSKGRSGLEWYEANENGKFEFIRSVTDFEPSTDVRDSWQVVEKMKRSNFSARHRFVTELQKEVTPKELKDKNQLLDLGWMIFYLTPKSICLAALKAAGVNIE